MNDMISRQNASHMGPMLRTQTFARSRRDLTNFAESRPASIAQFILRRAGIKPLMVALLAIVIPHGILSDTAKAATDSSTRVSATARALVVQNAVQINAGQLSLRHSEGGLSVSVDLRDLHVMGVQSAIRTCEAIPRNDAGGECKMIVYNLP